MAGGVKSGQWIVQSAQWIVHSAEWTLQAMIQAGLKEWQYDNNNGATDCGRPAEARSLHRVGDTNGVPVAPGEGVLGLHATRDGRADPGVPGGAHDFESAALDAP